MDAAAAAEDAALLPDAVAEACVEFGFRRALLEEDAVLSLVEESTRGSSLALRFRFGAMVFARVAEKIM